MTSSQYQQLSPAAEDDDSDPDLALDDLDPIPPHHGSSRRPGRAAFGDGEPQPPGALGRNIYMQRLRRHVSSHKDAEVEGFHRSEGEGRFSGGSAAEDDAPLLSESDYQDPGATTRTSQTDGSLVSANQNGKVSQILAKMRSNPRSEVEDEYDRSANRRIKVGHRQSMRFPPNIVSNAKYTPWSFLPRTIYHEFSFFLNMYFLLVALSQIIRPLRIGYLSTYIAPLAFVLVITIGKEAIDDIARRRRDAEANAERYSVLSFSGGPIPESRHQAKRERRRVSSRLSEIDEEEQNLVGSGGRSSEGPAGVREIFKTSRDLKVGDILKLGRDRRVPADVAILKTSPSDDINDSSGEGGETFIRTDQLDGETDWKLRLAPPLAQALKVEQLTQLQIEASKPEKKVTEFVGALSFNGGATSGSASEAHITSVPLTIDNTAWANTVIASSGIVLAAVVYTGPQTRQAMSTSASRTKTGLLEYEINSLTKILCALTLALSVLLVAVEKFETPDGTKWYVAVMRYLILFSTIVPISLRVNLDLGKSVYAYFIHRDSDIPDTVVRTSTIPEDLGRIEYLLSDKTGTLTQNDMQLRKIHVGTVSYANDAMAEVTSYVRQGFSISSEAEAVAGSATRSRREIGSRVRDLVLALAICHNVTPTTDEDGNENGTTYQASSPDEIAIVRWTESVGLRLAYRDRQTMILESSHTGITVARIEILSIFPFTSDGKRMGIIARFAKPSDAEKQELSTESIWFFQKGADTVMSSIVASNDWLDEETANMAREGLRTLVVGRKKLSSSAYEEFAEKYKEASVALQSRDEDMARVVKTHLEHDLDLLGVTGVEDKLQQDVKPSLELLRNAGIKIWMLTGDKVETARCVAVSSKLVARGQYVHTISKLKDDGQAHESLNFLRSKPDACLLIDGESLATILSIHKDEFISIAVRLSAVIACRCSPTQKAELARLIRSYTGKRICCIGDGGNDVSMIQAADVGVGIVGKEGRQASLAADFSIMQFCYLTKLLMWHGRNSYKRSAKLSQFVIHRGLIIAVAQTVYSIAIELRPDALYRDWLLVGYATVYTMAPVFSLVLDTDIPQQLAHVYPELYRELSTSRSLSYRTFFIWVAISVYQGTAIQLLSEFFVPDPSQHFHKMVSVSFTVLIINELLMVAFEVTTWHWIMIVTIFGTAAAYFGSIPFLEEYFNLEWILTLAFWWRVVAIAAVSLVPVYAMKILRRTVKPPSYRKVQQGL